MPNPLHFVCDFARVLFDWQPDLLLRRLLPRRAFDEASTAHWVAQVFQAYQGVWGDFDRGDVNPTDLLPRIAGAAQRFGVPAAELLLLDDHGPNVAATQAAGWQALQFHDAAQAERDIRAAGCWPAAA